MTGRLHALLAGMLALPAAAQNHAHEHGVIHLNVAVQSSTLSVQLDAPLDSLLGFEHRPRDAAQRAAAEALLTRLTDPAALLQPDAAAQCSLRHAQVESAALQAPAVGTPGTADATHADVQADYEFECQQPDRLATLALAWFEAFPRLQRIHVQVAGARGQFKQTLRRPARVLKLVR